MSEIPRLLMAKIDGDDAAIERSARCMTRVERIAFALMMVAVAVAAAFAVAVVLYAIGSV